MRFLGHDGMYPSWMHRQCSLGSLLWSTSECHLGYGSHVDSRAYSRAHVQVRFALATIRDTKRALVLQRLQTEFPGISSLDWHLDLRPPLHLCDIQLELPGQIHHSIYWGLLCVAGRVDLHLWCYPRNLENPPTLSCELSSWYSLGLLVFVFIHGSRREWNEYQRYSGGGLSLSRKQSESDFATRMCQSRWLCHGLRLFNTCLPCGYFLLFRPLVSLDLSHLYVLARISSKFVLPESSKFVEVEKHRRTNERSA